MRTKPRGSTGSKKRRRNSTPSKETVLVRGPRREPRSSRDRARILTRGVLGVLGTEPEFSRASADRPYRIRLLPPLPSAWDPAFPAATAVQTGVPVGSQTPHFQGVTPKRSPLEPRGRPPRAAVAQASPPTARDLGPRATNPCLATRPRPGPPRVRSHSTWTGPLRRGQEIRDGLQLTEKA